MSAKKVYNKLVRDRIPQIIEDSGAVPVTEVLGEEAYGRALFDKFFEEAEEYRTAESDDKIINELVDLYEVLLATAAYRGLTPAAFEQRRLAKHQARGGFEQRIMLKEVE